MKLSHPREHAPPTREQIARLAGLCDLRVGKHFLRDANKEPIGCVWVRNLWLVEIVPTFHPPTALAVIVAKGEAFQDCVSADWVKAVFATHQEAAVLGLEADPLVTRLNGMDLFHLDDQSCLDGIEYTFGFETGQLRGNLHFCNPTQPSLRALESNLLLLAEKVAAESGSPALHEAVETWREFVEDKGVKHKSAS